MKTDTRQPGVIRVSPDIYADLSRMSQLTRRPIGEIAGMAIRFGLKHSSVRPVQLYEISFDGGGDDDHEADVHA